MVQYFQYEKIQVSVHGISNTIYDSDSPKL